MGLIRNWLDWQEGLGSSTSSFLQELQTEIMSLSCSVYRKYPQIYTLTPFVKGLMGGYCSRVNQPLPDSPQADFDGGQCGGIPYRVVYDRCQDVPGQGYSFTGPQIINLSGPIATDGPYSNLRLFYDNIPQFERIGGRLGFGKVNTNVIYALIDGQTIKDYEFLRSITWGYAFFKFEPQDGSPEICPQTEVDPADLTKTVTINNYNQAGDIESNTDFNLSIPYIANDFNLNVDIGGVTVGVDIGGIQIGGDVTVNLGGPGGGNPSLPAPDNTDFDENDFEEFLPDGKDPDPEPVEEEEAESTKIKWILVNITQTPIKGRAIIMPNIANSDFFAGYFAWTVSFNGTRYSLTPEPIRKVNQAFKAPNNTLGYRMYAVNGAKLRATVYKQTEET